MNGKQIQGISSETIIVRNITVYVCVCHIIYCVCCTLLVQTFRDLLQPGEHLGQFLLSLSQLASAGEVNSEQSHDGVDDLNRGWKFRGGLREPGRTPYCF